MFAVRPNRAAFRLLVLVLCPVNQVVCVSLPPSGHSDFSNNTLSVFLLLAADSYSSSLFFPVAPTAFLGHAHLSSPTPTL